MPARDSRLQRKAQSPEHDFALSPQPADAAHSDTNAVVHPASELPATLGFSLDQIAADQADPAAEADVARLAYLSVQTPELLAGPAGQDDAPGSYDAAPFILQAALRVNEPNDRYEQEAEHVAHRVMRMPDTDAAGPTEPRPAPAVPLLDVQRASSDAGVAVTPEVEAGVAGLRGGGTPLPASERSFFEARMGADFGDVRIHTAPELIRLLNARAFTVGSDIAFDAGEYQPGSADGRALLAHELAHVVQQTGALPLHSEQDAVADPDAAVPASAAPLAEADPLPEQPVADSPLADALPDGLTSLPQPAPLAPAGPLDLAQAAPELEDGEQSGAATASAGTSTARRGYELDPITTLAIARMPATPEPEGICPVCGKRGTGTCPDCGQPFVPLQRFPAGDLPLAAQLSSDPGTPELQRLSLGDVKNAVSGGIDFVSGGLSAVADMGADGFMAIVERFAPQLAELIREGPIGMLTDTIKEGVQGWLQSILGNIDLGGVVGNLESSLADVFAAVSGMLTGDPSGCAALERTLDNLRGLGESITNNPLIQALQGVIEKVQGAFETISDLVLAPAFDALAGLAGGVFDKVKTLAGTIAGWGKQIGSFLGAAWDWVKEHLGMGGEGEGEGGIFEWLKEQASKAWSSIQETLQPVIGPLKTAGIAVLAFTPAGPIYLLVKYVPQLVESVQWLIKHREDPDMVKKAHDQMGGTILPTILDTVKSFGDTLGQVASTLADTAEALGNSVLDLLGAIGGVPLLELAQSMVQSVSDGIQRFVNWAKTTFSMVARDVQSLFSKVQEIVTPIIDVLVQIAPIILNPFGISGLLVGQAWQRLPDCYKAPIIDFLLDICIGYLEKMPFFPPFGPLWPFVKSGVLGFLEGLRNESDEVKVEISNRIAKIIGGSSPQFLFGFAKGLLKGLWEGLTDPFVMIYDLLKLLSSVLDWLEGPPAQGIKAAGAPAPAEAAESSEAEQPAGDTGADADADDGLDLGALLQAVGSELSPAITTITGDFWPAVQEYFSGGEGVSYETVKEKLGEAWASLEAGIEAAGATLAGELCEFFVKEVSDAELGESVGWLAGTITFEVVIGILTAGTVTALKPLQGIAKLLTWTDGAFEKALGALRKLGGVLLDGFKALQKAISNAGSGAIGRVLDALGELGEWLPKLADDLLGKAGRGGRKAGSKADGLIDDAAEGATKTAKAGDGLVDEAADVADDGLKPGKRTKADEATEAAELPLAIAEARAITEANEALNVPVPGLLAELAPLKSQFSWINSFDAKPKTSGNYTIIMRKEKKVSDYKHDVDRKDLQEEDGSGTQKIDKEFVEKPKDRRPFSSGKPPHIAQVSVKRGDKEVFSGEFKSGNMTAEEAKLKFPLSCLATHTEAKAVNQVPYKEGDEMTIFGKYPACNHCKGKMNKAVKETGAKIIYKWEDKEWIAGKKR